MEANNVNRMHASLESFDLSKLIRYVLMQIRLISVVSLCVFGFSYYNYTSADRIFLANTLLQKLNTPSNANEIFLGQSNPSDIDSVKELYLSRTNILNLIELLKLNISVSDESFSKKNINTFKLDDSEIDSKSYWINFSEETFKLFDQEVILGEFKYGKENYVDGLTLNISKPLNVKKDQFEIKYLNPKNLYQPIRSGFQLSAVGSSNIFYGGANILKVSYTSNDPDQAVAALDTANMLFLNANIFTETEQAQKAIKFIDQRLALVEDQLSIDKSNLTNFRSSNNTLNVDLEIRSILDSVQNIELSIYNLNLEISEARKSFTENNPILEQLLERRRMLEERRKEVESQIKALPTEQQEYIDLFRKLETTSIIAKELEAKKLEYSIKEASTLGNIRVVDNGYIVGIVSPRFSNVAFTTGLSLLFMLVFAVLRGIFFIPIFNPAEIKESLPNSKLIGVLPLENIESDSEGAIESLIVNMDYLLEDKGEGHDCKVVTLSSATAENGKSFSSRTVAKAYANAGKKVLLIDGDFKRGDQHKACNVKKISLEKFRNIGEDNLIDLKVDNFYLIPKIEKLLSSFEFLYSREFNKKLELLKNNFDLIIIDTAPILSVSDTSILMSISDVNVIVARHEVTKSSDLIQVNNLAEQLGQSVDGVIYNAYEKPKGYYGYTYYGNYDYQYYAKQYLYEDYKYEKKS